jgi:uncharacterized phiE125 gp8 family phage protein
MWYPAVVTAQPATEPVTPDEVKQQCGIASSNASYDAMITRLIATERGFVERHCGIKLVTQTVSVKCDSFRDFRNLTIAPVQSIASISYVDGEGVAQTVASSVYELRADDLVGSIELKPGQSWPAAQFGSRVTVSAVVGYTTVPPEIVSAILMRIGKQFAASRPDPLLKKEVVEGIGSKEWDAAGAWDSSLDKVTADFLSNFRCWAAL